MFGTIVLDQTYLSGSPRKFKGGVNLITSCVRRCKSCILRFWPTRNFSLLLYKVLRMICQRLRTRGWMPVFQTSSVVHRNRTGSSRAPFPTAVGRWLADDGQSSFSPCFPLVSHSPISLSLSVEIIISWIGETIPAMRCIRDPFQYRAVAFTTRILQF